MNEELMESMLDTHDKRLNNHSERLKILETHEAARDERIDNLCKRLERQTKSIYWLVGTAIVALSSFFIDAIQTIIFK